jgi:flagellar biosynthesis/type III secretory pathway ATPase
LWPKIQAFLQQGIDDTFDMKDSLNNLFEIVGGNGNP